MALVGNLAKQYEAAVECGKKSLPTGEEFQGIIFAEEKLSAVISFLRNNVFGFLINMFITPRSYALAYSDHTIAIIGFKKGVVVDNYDAEFTFQRKISEVEVKKGFSSYTVWANDENNKKHSLTVDVRGDIKKQFEYLVTKGLSIK